MLYLAYLHLSSLFTFALSFCIFIFAFFISGGFVWSLEVRSVDLAMRLARSDKSEFAMTREIIVPVKNTGITKGYQTASANMELYSYQAFASAR
jgi:hypothetical protein